MTTLIKNILKVMLVGSVACASSFAYADTNNSRGCELKIQNIKKQIEYAKSHGNSYRVNGLERALENTEKYCTDDSLRKDLNADIAKKQRKVEERTEDLKKAQLKGDAEKVANKQKKLDKAQEELKQAQDSLNTYYK